MIASTSTADLPDDQRVVITGIGLTAPQRERPEHVSGELIGGS